MRRILVLRGGALGDFIVTLPALLALRQRWPAAQIELVGNATAAAIAQPRGVLDRVHSQHEARWSALFNDAPLPDPLRRTLAEFDLVVNYWPDPDGALARHFPAASGQTFITAPAMPTRAPAAAHYVAALEPVGVIAPTVFCTIEADQVTFAPAHEPSRRTTSRHDDRPIAIHPGSGSPKKNWPATRWLELIRRLNEPVLLVLGEAEREPWCGCDGIGKHVRPLVAPDLEALIGELRTCRLFLGHDSGVSHLAAACGVPSVLLFGPTAPEMWAPPSPHVTVLRQDESLADIRVDEVAAAIGATAAG